jgi:hypothetical protein
MDRKEKYNLLRLAGYSSKDASNFRSLSAEKVKTLAKDKILVRLDSGEHLNRKEIRQYAKKIFDFTAKEADRVRSFSMENVKAAFGTHALPELGELVLKRAKDDIHYKKALVYDVLLGKARYNNNIYIYKVEYRVKSEVEFFRDKKYVSVYSQKKLSKKQVIEKVLTEIFPRHDEDYGTSPDPTSLKVIDAYYMTNADYKKLEKQRSDKK